MHSKITISTMATSERQTGLAELLGSVAAGREDALADLYRRVEGSIYAFAMSRLGDPDEATEVLHQVMLEVWRRARTFEGRSRARSWILGIAHHKIVDALRKRGRWRFEPPDEDLPDDATSPISRIRRREEQSAVQEAIAALSDDHRQVVHLAFFEDLSYPEIARALEIPEGTVKSRMFHARKKLRRRLESAAAGGAA